MNSTFRFSRFLDLIRAVFPKWNFFDRIACQFEIEFEDARAPGWRRGIFSAPLRPWSILIDLEASEALLQRGIVERFARELQDLAARPGGATTEEALSMVSGRMLRDLVWHKIGTDTPEVKWRFRVLAVEPRETIEVYRSPWFGMDPS